MKKYIIPTTEVIEIKAQTILTASGDGFAQDPTGKMEAKQSSITTVNFQF